ncbi:CAP domain-containing protein [Paraburkholderia youngii]|uniref:CAP domain-containing protein n=1 Tax=Paraburkholderia youngii TaxID=2782701 RepID=UPI003D23DC56
MSNTRIKFALAAAGLSIILAACGGGGGGGDSSGSSTSNNSSGSSSSTGSTGSSSSISGDVATAQYASGSIESATFTRLNAARTQCGLPALVENTYLDKSVVAHANYEMANSIASDTETAGTTGYTGINYTTRAQVAGFPTGVSVGGVSTGFYTTATLTNDGYAEQYITGLESGVYHVGVLMAPAVDVGIGSVSETFNNFPELWASLAFGGSKTAVSNGPATFPCQGSTDLPYSGTAETPTPPNTSGTWGTPIAVIGNMSDTITLTSGTISDSSGNSQTMQLLYSTNDPNKELPAYMATAYPAAALKPNTQYSVSITGTYNGVSFSRAFTFTTGSIAG